MAKRAWIVEPKLIDRFLNLLTDNDFKWVSGHNANDYKSWMMFGVTLLFIEEEPKTLLYVRYSTYLDESDEEYNVAEVTEELLELMEYDGVARMRRRRSMETLIKKVEQWAHEKEIDDYENWEKQFMKFQEESIELHTEMVLFDKRHEDFLLDDYFFEKEEMKLEMGDVLVTLIILAKQQDIELSDCLSLAWNKIKNRRGKTINGQFVKEEDL